LLVGIPASMSRFYTEECERWTQAQSRDQTAVITGTVELSPTATSNRLRTGSGQPRLVFRTMAFLLCSSSVSSAGVRILVNHAALHHEADALQASDVGERIIVHRDNVSIFARFDCSDVLSHSD